MQNTMIDFETLLQRWHEADAAACAAERALGLALDAWCEGRGPAPAQAASAEVRQLRADALQAWDGVCAFVSRERRSLPLL